jgi:hypothetical protein
MRRELFLKIKEVAMRGWFIWEMLLRFWCFIVTIKMLAYGAATNAINKYYRLSESLAHEYTKKTN